MVWLREETSFWQCWCGFVIWTDFGKRSLVPIGTKTKLYHNGDTSKQHRRNVTWRIRADLGKKLEVINATSRVMGTFFAGDEEHDFV